MIKLQIKELCELRGIKAPLTVLIKAGISQKVANDYLMGKKKQLLLSHIEKLCAVLRCTPNDLFIWTPDNAAQDYPANTLQCIRHTTLPHLHRVINELSLEEVKRRLG